MQVISLSDQKEIALEVTVTNQDGDDAYEATLNVTLPPTLVYSAYRSSLDVRLMRFTVYAFLGSCIPSFFFC